MIQKLKDFRLFLLTKAKEYRIGANDSLVRNSYLNDNIMGEISVIPQQVVDAILIDFINSATEDMQDDRESEKIIASKRLSIEDLRD